MRRAAKTPVVAAVSEDLVRAVAEKAVKFKVRAVVTVRNKNNEDFKEKIFKRLDALTEVVGRNVVLELVSTEIDPSN